MTSTADLVPLLKNQLTDARFDLHDNQVKAVTSGRGYVVIYDASDHAYSDRLDDTVSDFVWPFRLQCSGFSIDQARKVVAAVRELLADFWIDELGAKPVEQLNGAPLIKDESVPNDLRWSRLLDYRLTTFWS